MADQGFAAAYVTGAGIANSHWVRDQRHFEQLIARRFDEAGVAWVSFECHVMSPRSALFSQDSPLSVRYVLSRYRAEPTEPERFAFYEAAKKGFCVVRTSEFRPYGCFLFTMGVIFDKVCVSDPHTRG